MARRTNIKLPGVRTWVDNIKNTVSQEAAKQIVSDLQEIGPVWSGQFRDAWVVKAGDVRIRADRKNEQPPYAPRTASGAPAPVSIPRARGTKSIFYTIGNEMEYRLIAMDLLPAEEYRLKGGRIGTAPKDWYRTYVEGGNLRLTLQQATNRAAQDPKVRGFRG